MVYVEILVLIELFMNYVIIIATGILLNRITKFKKTFLASVIGSFSLIFLYIPINQHIINILTIIFAFFMSIIAYGYKNILYTLKNIIYMYFISIFLAGSIYLINTSLIPNVDNYYLNAILLLIISPIITYLYIKSLSKIKTINNNYYKVDIYLKDKPKITLIAYLDTGNKLIDPYTFKPIILVSNRIITYNPKKFIIVPYNTIDNSGILKCFKPEKIYIDKVGYRHKLLIGLVNNIGIEGADCILNQKLIERI